MHQQFTGTAVAPALYAELTAAKAEMPDPGSNGSQNPISTHSATVALDVCSLCFLEVYEHDRFCRHCGVDLHRSRTGPALISQLKPQGTVTRSVSSYATARLAPSWAAPFCARALTGEVIAIIDEGTTQTTGSSRGAFTRAAAMVLLPLPILLAMVLLSPLDAVAAARTIARRL